MQAYIILHHSCNLFPNFEQLQYDVRMIHVPSFVMFTSGMYVVVKPVSIKLTLVFHP